MKIYLATWLEDNQGITLTNVGYNRRLLSYYFIREAAPDFLNQYSKTGVYTGGLNAGKKERLDSGTGHGKTGSRKKADY
jgi:hypothetical protein